MKPIVCYTDGSCNFKNKLGGIGIYIIDNDKKYTYSKGYSHTTIGRCELRALLCAFRFIKNKSRKLIIYSDSMYVVNTIQLNWIERWASEMWYDRKNVDILTQILAELEKFKFRPLLKHVKGHQKSGVWISKNLNKVNRHVLGNYIADRCAEYSKFVEYEKDFCTL